MINKKYILLCLIFFSSLCAEMSYAQAEDVKKGDTKREEVQRYFGYELLPFRYISLPYDVSINVNEKGDFVDVGPLLLIFIPILFLYFLLDKPKYFILIILGLLLFWIISLSNGILFLNHLEIIQNERNALVDFLQSSCNNLSCYLTSFLAYFYYLSHLVNDNFSSFLSNYTGNQDYFTYPMVFSIFIGLCLIARQLLRNEKSLLKPTLILFFLFTFFWTAFSAGIIWYGYLMLVLGFIVIELLISKIVSRRPRAGRIFAISFRSLTFLWLFLVGAQKISRTNVGISEDRMGKNMFQPVLFQNMTHLVSDEQVVNAFYPNFSEALELINSENQSLIYRIGTSFSYFIDNNSERIQIDNQLGIFSALYAKYPSKIRLANALKASGFKYILLDLNTPFIDRTPEQSLAKKFHNFMKFSKDNPRLKLLSTNRQIIEMENGQPKLFYGIWGEIHYGGQYAIYELL